MRKTRKTNQDKKREYFEILNTISKGRQRTNILKKPEQTALAFLVKHIPAWVSSDMLTFFGFCGSLLTAASFVMAAHWSRTYLLLGVLGFIINWFGDSLDGRLAYYRNTPRKWYGFSLDITVDWFTTLLIGIGYALYTQGFVKFFGLAFVLMYSWAMITTLMRYKVTDQYSIDTGILGPTEVRVVISLILLTEIFVKDSIVYTGALACVTLLVVNVIGSVELLLVADKRDKDEKESKEKQAAEASTQEVNV